MSVDVESWVEASKISSPMHTTYLHADGFANGALASALQIDRLTGQVDRSPWRAVRDGLDHNRKGGRAAPGACLRMHGCDR